MNDRMIPKEALDYIKNKKLKVGFSYKDVWLDEHAASFTVAKAMQLDVLRDIKTAVEKAIENGESFDQFKKNLKPTLQQKGWWGKKHMIDPLTGKVTNAQLGSNRRLKVMYETNLRAAAMKRVYDDGMASDAHPYFMYRLGPSAEHRSEHVQFDGLILPKTDPFWDKHFPIKEFGCKCYLVAVSEYRKARYEKDGNTVPADDNGNGAETHHIKTKAPKEEYTTYFNERKGIATRVPKGVHPAFAWNPSMPRSTTILDNLVIKSRNTLPPQQYDEVIKSFVKSSANKYNHYHFVEKAIKDAQNKTQDGKELITVSVLESKLIDFLKKQLPKKQVNPMIALESKLITSAKYRKRHATMGNAPSTEDWYNIMDYLIDASVYFDGTGLIYLYKKSESVYVKIAIDIDPKIEHKGTIVKMPKVDTMYLLDISDEGDRGINEYQRIIEMKKIR